MLEMRRRKFMTLLGGAAAASMFWPRAARAQASPKRSTIAWIGTSQQLNASFIENFLRGMKELGYAEGRSFDMLYRFTDGCQGRLPAISEEVIRLKPDVILAAAVVYAVEARKVTSTIPIVTPALADAVRLGLIASEARPGGNVTGIEPYVSGLPAKQIEFAREIVPGAGRIGLLTNLQDPKAPAQAQELEASARAAGIKIVSADANQPDDLEGALRILSDARVDVVIVLQTSMLLSYRERIAASALAKRLPTVYGYREHVVAGGLVTYGVDLRWCFYRGAYFVDRILRGTAPGDLPIEFPTQMFLAVNLKTAGTLGITVKPTLIGLADEVIECNDASSSGSSAARPPLRLLGRLWRARSSRRSRWSDFSTPLRPSCTSSTRPPFVKACRISATSKGGMFMSSIVGRKVTMLGCRHSLQSWRPARSPSSRPPATSLQPAPHRLPPRKFPSSSPSARTRSGSDWSRATTVRAAMSPVSALSPAQSAPNAWRCFIS